MRNLKLYKKTLKRFKKKNKKELRKSKKSNIFWISNISVKNKVWINRRSRLMNRDNLNRLINNWLRKMSIRDY